MLHGSNLSLTKLSGTRTIRVSVRLRVKNGTPGLDPLASNQNLISAIVSPVFGFLIT